MTVYLAGPMEGISQQQSTDWRNKARDFLENWVEVLDPCRRKKFHDQPYSNNLANRIVTMDLQDIDESMVILANLSNLNGAKAWGSVSEITYAAMKGKIVITVVDEGYHHPFIDSFSTEVHNSLEKALEVVAEYYV